MLENTLPQLEQLIEDIISKNNQLKSKVVEQSSKNLHLLMKTKSCNLKFLKAKKNKAKQTMCYRAY